MDIEHHFIEKGSGEPLILLHGNGESSDYFTAQIEEFSKSFHVYAPDTRGHGGTPRGGGPFTLSRFADDLNEFMNMRGIEKANLLGFSDGGNIALIFTLRYPGRVDRLILNGANINPRGVKASTQLPVEAGYRIAKLFAGKSPDAAANAEMLGLMVNEPRIEPDELGGIKSKTLVIAGTADVIKKKHTQLIARSIPGARLCFIKGGHYIAGRSPAAFNRAVLDFLREADSTKRR